MVWAIVRNLRLGRLGCRGRRVVVFFALALGVLVAMAAAFALRFDFSIPRPELRHLLIGLLIALPVKLVIFQLTQQHRGWWTSFGLIDLSHLISINVVASVTSGLGIFAAVGSAFPRSIYVLDFVLTVGFTSLERTLLRLYREHPSRRGKQLNGERKPVLIYGAGWAGSGF